MARSSEVPIRIFLGYFGEIVEKVLSSKLRQRGAEKIRQEGLSFLKALILSVLCFFEGDYLVFFF